MENLAEKLKNETGASFDTCYKWLQECGDNYEIAKRIITKYCKSMVNDIKNECKMNPVNEPSTVAEKKEKFIFFSHPMPTYNTPYEKILMKVIKDKFPEYTIINPAEEKYQNFQTNTQQEAMDFFTDLILNKATILIGLPIFTGNYTDGVATEMIFALEHNIPTYSFDKDMNIFELSNVVVGNVGAIHYVKNRKLTLEQTKYVRALGIM